ncbi:hypothetical protein ACFQX4_25850 [Roseomonas sp. GCM10028921]
MGAPLEIRTDLASPALLRRLARRERNPRTASRLLAHAMIYGHFRPGRHLMTPAQHRRARAKAFRIWREETCVQITA